jgi:hypothetical protein
MSRYSKTKKSIKSPKSTKSTKSTKSEKSIKIIEIEESSINHISADSSTNTSVVMLNSNTDSIENFKKYEFKKYCSRYSFTPFIFNKVKRIVVLGDIHGDYDLAIKLLTISKVAKIRKSNDNPNKSKKNNKLDLSSENDELELEWIGKDTYVVQVGDQIDRCRPIGSKTCDNPNTIRLSDDENSDLKILKLFTKLHEAAKKDGGAVISLLGNHELMNSLGETQYVSFVGLKEIFEKYKVDGIEFNDGADARKHAFKPGNKYANLLGCSRNAAVIIGSNLFVHAGLIDTFIEKIGLDDLNDFESVNILIKKWLLGLVNTNDINTLVKSQDSMFWTRILGSIPAGKPMEYEECKNNVTNVLKLFNINGMIVGHTPQSFLFNKDINATCSNKIWRVDNGSSKAFNPYDKYYLDHGKQHHNRRPQYLEILNDTEFNIYDENGKIN